MSAREKDVKDTQKMLQEFLDQRLSAVSSFMDKIVPSIFRAPTIDAVAKSIAGKVKDETPKTAIKRGVRTSVGVKEAPIEVYKTPRETAVIKKEKQPDYQGISFNVGADRFIKDRKFIKAQAAFEALGSKKFIDLIRGKCLKPTDDESKKKAVRVREAQEERESKIEESERARNESEREQREIGMLDVMRTVSESIGKAFIDYKRLGEVLSKNQSSLVGMAGDYIGLGLKDLAVKMLPAVMKLAGPAAAVAAVGALSFAAGYAIAQKYVIPALDKKFGEMEKRIDEASIDVSKMVHERRMALKERVKAGEISELESKKLQRELLLKKTLVEAIRTTGVISKKEIGAHLDKRMETLIEISKTAQKMQSHRDYLFGIGSIKKIREEVIEDWEKIKDDMRAERRKKATESKESKKIEKKEESELKTKKIPQAKRTIEKKVETESQKIAKRMEPEKTLSIDVPSIILKTDEQFEEMQKIIKESRIRAQKGKVKIEKRVTPKMIETESKKLFQESKETNEKMLNHLKNINEGQKEMKSAIEANKPIDRPQVHTFPAPPNPAPNQDVRRM
jgi:hypothetical protein